jgi:hypothetical protein
MRPHAHVRQLAEPGRPCPVSPLATLATRRSISSASDAALDDDALDAGLLQPAHQSPIVSAARGIG